MSDNGSAHDTNGHHPDPLQRVHGERRHKGLLIALLFLALVVRLGWGLSRPSDGAALNALPDQREYLELGRNLLEGRGLCFYDPAFNTTVYAYRMPGYPLLVAACGGKVTIVRIVQALLDTLTVLAAYRLARRVALDRWPALAAAALVAFNPYLIYFSALLLSETLFTAMLAWGMLMMLSPRRWVFAGGALVLALSIFVRPSAIALPVILGALTPLLRVTLPGRSFWRVPAGTMMILLTILVLSPWAMRNRQRVEAWVFTTTNSGITLYDGLNPRADGSSNQAYFRSWPELKTIDEVQRSEYLGNLAKEFASEHPRQALKLAGLKIARTWSPIPLSAEYGTNRLYVAAGLMFAVPLFVLVAVGMWSGPISRSAKLFLLVPAVYFTIVHAVTVGSLRYRIPADVPMAVVAAAGAVNLVRSRQRPIAVDSE